MFTAVSNQVKIMVTGFSTPKSQKSSSTWSVTVYRFGTGTVIADYDGTATIALTAGAINNISLSPYLTDSCTSNLARGMTTFY